MMFEKFVPHKIDKICEKCPFLKSPSVFPSEDELKKFKKNPPKLIIIGINPGQSEIEQGKVFVGKSGDFLWSALSSYGITRENCFATNMVHCFDKEIKITVPIIKRCKYYLDKEIEGINCDRFLLLGNVPVQGILGLTLTEIKDKVVLKDNKYFAIMAHPAAYMRKYGSDAKSRFISDTLKVLDRLFNNDLKKEKIKYKFFKDANELIRILKQLDEVAIDLETSSIEWQFGDIKLLGVGNDKFAFVTDNVTKDLILELSKHKLIGHNIKFDLKWIYDKFGIWLPIHADTQLAAYIIDQNRKHYSLQSLCYEYVPELVHYGEDIKGSKDWKTYINPEYNASDVIKTARLYKILKDKLKDKDFLWNFLIKAERALMKMEYKGVLVDTKYLDILTKKFERKLQILKKKIESMTDGFLDNVDVKFLPQNLLRFYKKRLINKTPFNPSSDHDIRLLFYGVYGLSYKDYKSFKNEVLLKLEDKYPIAGYISKYRKFEKLFSTYGKGIKSKLINGVAYTNFNLTRTITGRTSSGSELGREEHKFNFQNLPRTGGVREMIVARPNKLFLGSDYSTIEVCIAGALSRDEKLIEILKSGKDVHTMIASTIFNIPYEKVQKEQRQFAKSVTFGILYGMTSIGLAKRLNISEAEAQQLIDSFFGQFSQIRETIDRCVSFVERNHYINTPFGRIRKFDKFDEETKRQAFNTVVQSVASDIMLISLGDINEIIEESLLEERIYPVIEAHDEIIFEIDNDEKFIREMEEFITYEMTKGIRKRHELVDKLLGPIDLAVETKLSKRWQSKV